MRGIGTLLSVYLLAGIGSGQAAAPPRSEGVFVEGIELAAQEQDLARGVASSRFNLMQLRDLWVRVKVARIPKTAAFDLAFISPRGERFYETRLYYSRDPKVSSVRQSGTDQPATVLPARRLPGGFALDQPIPIAGGVFVRYPIPGTWVVRATVTGQDEPLTTTFEALAFP